MDILEEKKGFIIIMIIIIILVSMEFLGFWYDEMENVLNAHSFPFKAKRSLWFNACGKLNRPFIYMVVTCDFFGFFCFNIMHYILIDLDGFFFLHNFFNFHGNKLRSEKLEERLWKWFVGKERKKERTILKKKGV